MSSGDGEWSSILLTSYTELCNMALCNCITSSWGENNYIRM